MIVLVNPRRIPRCRIRDLGKLFDVNLDLLGRIRNIRGGVVVHDVFL